MGFNLLTIQVGSFQINSKVGFEQIHLIFKLSIFNEELFPTLYCTNCFTLSNIFKTTAVATKCDHFGTERN
jgi:hypothetical protein